MSNKQLNSMTEEEYREAVIRIIESGRGYDAIKYIAERLNHMDKLASHYCAENESRLTAIRKIANSSQTPKQKINGIKALADMRGDAE